MKLNYFLSMSEYCLIYNLKLFISHRSENNKCFRKGS